LTGRRSHYSRQQLYSCRLSRTVGTDESDRLTFWHAEGNAVYGDNCPRFPGEPSPGANFERLTQIFCYYCLFHDLSPLFSRRSRHHLKHALFKFLKQEQKKAPHFGGADCEHGRDESQNTISRAHVGPRHPVATMGSSCSM